MKRAMLALLLGMVISGSMLHLGADPARAAGPAVGAGPWIDGTVLVTCLDPDTHPMWNTASGKGHCFKN